MSQQIKDKKVSFDSLSDDQKAAYQEIFAEKPDRASKYFFVTGGAGVGKSHLIKYISDNHRTAICASTGIAAYNIGGCTVHRMFGMRINSVRPDRRVVLDNLKNIDVLIIDEISMLGKELFDKCMEDIAGLGITVVLVGDFFQLPPVKEEFCFKGNFWQNVKTLILTTNHRQSSARQEYVNSLNFLRVGGIDEYMAGVINRRRVDKLPDDCTNIVPHRITAEEINTERLMSIGKEIYYNTAVLTWSAYQDESLTKEKMASITTIPYEVRVCEGARIVMLNNSPDRMWVNGSTGVVSEIDRKYNKIYVDLDDGGTVCVMRSETEIYGANKKIVSRILQYPIDLAYAITIHKSQGMTLKKVGVVLSNHFGPGGMTYTAMTRCETEDGLYLLGVINPHITLANPEVINFYYNNSNVKKEELPW